MKKVFSSACLACSVVNLPRPPSDDDWPRLVHHDPRGRFIVVDKPAGVLSVPGKGEAKQDCVASRVLERWVPGGVATGAFSPIVHRLDMDTSGLMVLALDPETQRRLSADFEARRVDKAYIARIHGCPPMEEGTIDLPMRLDVDHRPMQIVDHAHGKPALTRWKLLAMEPGGARLRLEPHTGRTHQLRVHCAAIGHPIIGDVLYGLVIDRDPLDPSRPAERLMLHASELEFPDPSGSGRVRCTLPPGF